MNTEISERKKTREGWPHKGKLKPKAICQKTKERHLFEVSSAVPSIHSEGNNPRYPGTYTRGLEEGEGLKIGESLWVNVWVNYRCKDCGAKDYKVFRNKVMEWPEFIHKSQKKDDPTL